MKAVEDEFGEPLQSVVMGFRGDGYNYETIAGALDIPLGTFLRWKSKVGLRDYRIIVNNPKAPTENKAKALGYPNLEAMIIEYHSSGKMLRELASDLGCWASTLYRHMPEEIKGHWVNDPSQKKNNPAGGYKSKRGAKWSLDRGGGERDKNGWK